MVLPELMACACTTGSDVTVCDRKRLEVTEAIACACAYFPHVFFLTRVVQNVGTRDRRSRDPEPSGACMRNRKLGFPYFFKFYSATSLQQLFTYIHINRHMMAIKND